MVTIITLQKQDAKNVEEKGKGNIADITPCKQTKIEGVLDTNNSMDVLSRNLRDEVESYDNITAREQTEDIPDSLSLLHQRPSEIQESATNNFRTGLSGDLMAEGQETSDKYATGVSKLASQASLQPPAVEAATSEINDQVPVPELNMELNISCGVITIASVGIISALIGYHRHENAVLTHSIIFKAYTLLSYASLISGVCLLLLTVTRPNISGFVTIVKFTMWIALAFIASAIAFATCILLSKSLVVLVLVLVVPLVLVGLVIVLRFRNRKT